MKNIYDILIAIISVVAIILSILSLTKSEKFDTASFYRTGYNSCIAHKNCKKTDQCRKWCERRWAGGGVQPEF